MHNKQILLLNVQYVKKAHVTRVVLQGSQFFFICMSCGMNIFGIYHIRDGVLRVSKGGCVVTRGVSDEENQ